MTTEEFEDFNADRCRRSEDFARKEMESIRQAGIESGEPNPFAVHYDDAPKTRPVRGGNAGTFNPQ